MSTCTKKNHFLWKCAEVIFHLQIVYFTNKLLFVLHPLPLSMHVTLIWVGRMGWLGWIGQVRLGQSRWLGLGQSCRTLSTACLVEMVMPIISVMLGWPGEPVILTRGKIFYFPCKNVFLNIIFTDKLFSSKQTWSIWFVTDLLLINSVSKVGFLIDAYLNIIISHM